MVLDRLLVEDLVCHVFIINHNDLMRRLSIHSFGGDIWLIGPEQVVAVVVIADDVEIAPVVSDRGLVKAS